MIQTRILGRNGALKGIRMMSNTRRTWQAVSPEESALPSTQEMKSTESWSSKTRPNNMTNRVIEFAKELQESAKEAPIRIDNQFTNRFDAGSTYDPFDFGTAKLETRKKMARDVQRKDPFGASGIDPLNLYTMPEILSKFLLPLGQILSRNYTGCNAANQKKLAIAVKRARSVGLLSSTHRHQKYLVSRSL
ncbi:28S ribosomal protein S18c, mitochondrial [Scheffersomyces spartinae]|uniref:Small ribosomal subunit protein bS18m n=1 Tax=Scheffersomyces spartinae TaxID=45513 RepID=A0A9P8AHV7_9ASCO|nr:28S ribosomal protein S18c, mitochondrial [Scheffersomyces spartinae]KAG7193094.1 28S ribosomal protein S18c, mitochondrial [Scheffersomyces spartinae]